MQNRIIQTEREFGAKELEKAGNFLNEHCAGKTLDNLVQWIQGELVRIKSDIVGLMNAAVDISASLSGKRESVVIAGEHQLLGISDLSSNVARMKQLFDLFEQKTSLLQLLELGHRAEGVQIYIGNEAGARTARRMLGHRCTVQRQRRSRRHARRNRSDPAWPTTA